MGDLKALAGFFFPGILHHRDEMVSDVCHHCVFVRAGLNSLLIQKTFGHPFQLSFGKFDRLPGFSDVAFEIGGQARKLFSHLLHLGSLRFG